MNQKNFQQAIIHQLKQNFKFATLFFLLLISLNISQHTQANTNLIVPNQTRIYQLNVRTSYENITTSYYGIQKLILNSTDSLFYNGHLIWNLTWDNGFTWYSDNASFTYAWNRTYNYAGLTCFTAWWIYPVIQLGDQVQIDGDVPATNNFIRTSPFTVTDLVSFTSNQQHYLCWQLTYPSGTQQHETYYYEYHTGMLISATSTLLRNNHPVHEVQLELQRATPAPPPIHPLLHYWTNYYSFILAFVTAVMVTVIVYYLIQRIRNRHNSPSLLSS